MRIRAWIQTIRREVASWKVLQVLVYCMCACVRNLKEYFVTHLLKSNNLQGMKEFANVDL